MDTCNDFKTKFIRFYRIIHTHSSYVDRSTLKRIIRSSSHLKCKSTINTNSILVKYYIELLNLSNLDLSNLKNYIDFNKINFNILNSCKQLKSISFAYNDLKSIPIVSIRTLVKLDMSHNCISSIENFEILYINYIPLHLNLSYNQIQIFTCNRHIKELNISYNNLTKLIVNVDTLILNINISILSNNTFYKKIKYI